jgi:lipoprotein-anchoring transpeptidase ErfK/SrfK
MGMFRHLKICFLLLLLIPANQSESANAATKAASGPLNMYASLSKRMLVVGIGRTPIRKYEVAIGTKAHPTPQGLFSVRHIVWNPSWRPPDAAWAADKQPAAPGDPDNPMKVVKIFFQEPDYYIHGTDNKESIGSAASHGCLRMSEHDAANLAKLLMEKGGASKPAAWYEKVQNADTSANVQLPRSIPFRIAK